MVVKNKLICCVEDSKDIKYSLSHLRLLQPKNGSYFWNECLADLARPEVEHLHPSGTRRIETIAAVLVV